jgi:hypothetical protein
MVGKPMVGDGLTGNVSFVGNWESWTDVGMVCGSELSPTVVFTPSTQRPPALTHFVFWHSPQPNGNVVVSGGGVVFTVLVFGTQWCVYTISVRIVDNNKSPKTA